MKYNERLIQFYDLSLVGLTRARDITGAIASPRSLDELMEDFHVLRERNQARKRVVGTTSLEYKLEDMEERRDCWILLVNIVDGSVAHPVTQVIGGTNADRQVVDLSGNRGIESSAHLVLYKQPNEAGKYLCLSERVANLPFSKIVAFFNYLARTSAKNNPEFYRKPHPDGSAGKYINTYCSLGMLGHPSDQFLGELESGVLSDIRLTSDANIVHGYDAQVHTDLVGAEVKMKLGRLNVLASGGNWGHVQKAIRYGNSLNSPFVRVQFKDATGAGHTAELSVDTGQLVNADRYVKKVRIQGFTVPLSTSYPVIEEGIRDKMLEL